MIGSWSSSPTDILLLLVQLVLIIFVLYFLAIMIYWFNRTGKVPSFSFILKNMVQLAKWFPKILVHRVKMVPARLRKKKVQPYPELSIQKKKKVTKKKKR